MKRQPKFKCIECQKQYKFIIWAQRHQIKSGHGAMADISIWQNVEKVSHSETTA